MRGLFKDLDPQVAGEHLEMLVERYKDHLTADEILADASKKSSPLHNVFEWDDSVAAHRQRRSTASNLAAGLIVKQPGKKKTQTRAFVYAQIPGETRKSFIPLRSAMGRTEIREQVFKQAVRGLERWINHYGGQREFKFLAGRVEGLRRRIEIEYMTAAGLR